MQRFLASLVYFLAVVKIFSAAAVETDCRPCEQGRFFSQACQPQTKHPTVCEDCFQASMIEEERNSSAYQTACAPLADKCNIDCPAGQYIKQPCNKGAPPNFVTCFYCDKTDRSNSDYMAKCLNLTTPKPTPALTSGHSLSAHDIAHGHGQAANPEVPAVVITTTTTTITTVEEEPVYEDSVPEPSEGDRGTGGGGGGGKTGKTGSDTGSSTTPTRTDSGSQTGTGGTTGGSSGTGDSGNSSGGTGDSGGSSGGTGDGGAVNGGVGGGGEADQGQRFTGSPDVDAVRNTDSSGSAVHHWINWIVLAIILLAILLIILAVICWRCHRRRKQVPKSDTMTQPIMMSENANGHLLGDVESPIVKVQTSAQHAAPPNHSLASKKKIWGSREFPWIDEDIKEPFT